MRFMDSSKQKEVVNNERSFRNFVINNKDWVDPTTQVLAVEGDDEGLRMVVNQIHYKSIKGENMVEYEDILGAKSYVEALLGVEKTPYLSHKGDDLKADWKIFVNRKSKDKANRANSTVFVAKLPLKI